MGRLFLTGRWQTLPRSGGRFRPAGVAPFGPENLKPALRMFCLCFHLPNMGTKRFEDLEDCYRHGTGFVVECLACGRRKHFSLLTRPKGLRSNLPYEAAAKRFRCGACGSKRISLYPGTRACREWFRLTQRPPPVFLASGGKVGRRLPVPLLPAGGREAEAFYGRSGRKSVHL
jgi:hypothetical protein